LITLLREAGYFWASLIFIQSVLANVVCDYVALFIIRRFLVMGKLRPMIASLLAPVAGISIVYVVFYGLVFAIPTAECAVDSFASPVHRTAESRPRVCTALDVSYGSFATKLNVSITVRFWVNSDQKALRQSG